LKGREGEREGMEERERIKLLYKFLKKFISNGV
jgi:hypothetical protein